MSNAIAVSAPEELRTVLQSSLYPGASNAAVDLVVGYCKAASLDVMQKPVHIVPMWDKEAKKMRDVIMPGIGLYRIQAARTGEYAGISDPEFGEDVSGLVGGKEITYPKWCKVTVRRRLPNGVIGEFSAVERWIENYATASKDTASPNAMWHKRPYAQLNKCAEAQALRKAFPEVGAAPTAEEMDGKTMFDEQNIVQDSPKKEVAPAPYPQNDFENNLDKWAKVVASKRKNLGDLVAMVNSKANAQLTEEQVEALNQAAKTLSEAIVDVQPKEKADGVMSFAQVADAIEKSTDELTLDMARGLVPAVNNHELETELYSKCAQKFNKIKQSQ